MVLQLRGGVPTVWRTGGVFIVKIPISRWQLITCALKCRQSIILFNHKDNVQDIPLATQRLHRTSSTARLLLFHVLSEA